MQNKERSAACPVQIKNACFLLFQIILENLFHPIFIGLPSFWSTTSLHDTHYNTYQAAQDADQPSLFQQQHKLVKSRAEGMMQQHRNQTLSLL